MSSENRWWTLAAVCVATFMLLLDITIVNVAQPEIQKDFQSSLADLQWVVGAYALSLAAFQLTAGSIADLRGRRLVFVAGLGVFTVASLLCGLAADATQLNLARALQGVGGSAMFATSLALLAHAFRGPDRGVAFGVWGATIGAAVAIGPLVGGAITEHLGWEWIFFVNVPIGAAAIAFTLAKVEESRNPSAGGVDWAGLALFSSGLFLLVLALIRGNDQGWGSATTLLELAGAAALMAAFLAVERRRRDPMLDLSLFGRPAFAGVSVVAFALSAGMFSMFLYLTLYVQNVLGYSPLETGVRFLPLTVASFVTAPFAGRMAHRVAPRALFAAGLGMVSIGLLLMHGIEPGDDWTTLLDGMIVAGIGVGITNPTIAQVAVGVVSADRSGMAAGINNTFRQVGIATGIAGLGAIFQSQLGGGAGSALGRGSASAFIDALNHILVVGALVAFAGALAGLLLVRSSDLEHGAETAPAAA